jgi:hypothetical protein
MALVDVASGFFVFWFPAAQFSWPQMAISTGSKQVT